MPLPYPGETGTSGADGITSGVLGLNCGAGTGTGGGTCATAAANDNSRTVGANNVTGHRAIAIPTAKNALGVKLTARTIVPGRPANGCSCGILRRNALRYGAAGDPGGV